MINVTKTNRWFGTGILAPAGNGGPVMTKARLRQGTGVVVFLDIAAPRSGVQLQA